MSLELVVDSRNGDIVLALLEDGKLIELHEEQPGKNEFTVGDIYLGKVRKVVPSLNAAFVDVGYEKDAFLHYLDLGPQFNSLNKFSRGTLKGKQNVADLLYFKGEKDIPKDGKINDVVSSSAPILVQVAKEPISSKGPRLCAEITLAGRYLVLVPFSNKVSISQKIKDNEERARLKIDECHQTEEFWSDHSNGSRRKKGRNARSGFEKPGWQMEKDAYELESG